MNDQDEIKTILVVDDDHKFRAQQRAEFEDRGYVVVEADSRRNARELLQRRSFDIAVVDLMMEEADSGFTLAREIKQSYPGMPVIIITGAAREMGIEFDVSTEEERRWIKADAMLTKPIRFEQLHSEMQRLFHE